LLRLALICEVGAPWGIGGDARQASVLIPIVNEVSERKRILAGSGTARINPDQLLWLPERELAQQDAIDQTEDRRVRADAERQCDNSDQSEAGLRRNASLPTTSLMTRDDH
jgi:hypothetical protein